MQHQNELNEPRLCELLEVEEKLRKELDKKQEKIIRAEKENEELQKELKVKKKFAFKI